LKSDFEVHQYGKLEHDPERYPLMCLKTKDFDENKPNVLVTGGVHGYETSGVQGALLFLQTEAKKYEEHFNFFVFPCVSPWGYECIQRWDK
jgi:murein tripeptide amidase MpaA